MQLANGLLVAV